MADTLTAQLNGLFPKIYDKAILVARAQNVMLQLVTVFDDRQDIADRIFKSRSGVTAIDIAENADIPSTTFTTAADATITPNEIAAQYVLSDRVVRTDPDIWMDAGEDLGNGMAEKIDRDLTGVFSGFTGGSTGGAGVTPTYGHIAAARSLLRAQGIAGPYWCVLHEYVQFTLSSSVSLEQAMKNTPEVIREELAQKWYIGTLWGDTHFITTPHIPVNGNGDAVCGLFPQMAIAYDSRKEPYLEPFRSPKGRKTELNMVADRAYGLAHPARGAKMTFAAPTPA